MVSQIDYLYDIVLDYQGMEIKRVANIFDEDISFIASEENDELGGALRIFLSNPMMKGKSIDVIVYYKTNEE